MKTLSSIKEYFTPSEITTPRTNNFNIIRVFAAFMVIYGHMGTIMGTSVFALLGCAVSPLGVKILFTVSGYLSPDFVQRSCCRTAFDHASPRRTPSSPGHVGCGKENTLPKKK